MAHLPASVHQLLAAQHGVVSTVQLRSAGLSESQIKRFEIGGSLASFLKGTYRSPSWPVGEMTRCAAICLGRPHVVVSGPTAGRIWGLRRLPADHRVHVIAPPGRTPTIERWARAYRTEAIHSLDVIQRDDGIRVTSRARTALDLARFTRPDDLLSIVEQAMHDGHLSEADMYSVAVDWISPQRPWVMKFLRLLGRRLTGGSAESHAEVVVGAALSQAGVTGLERQHRLTLPGYGPARFDLAVPKLLWAIEVDVFPTHLETIGAKRDEDRDNAAGIAGWIVSRVSRAEYQRRLPDRIAELVAIHRTLVRRPKLIA